MGTARNPPTRYDPEHKPISTQRLQCSTHQVTENVMQGVRYCLKHQSVRILLTKATVFACETLSADIIHKRDGGYRVHRRCVGRDGFRK